MNLFLIFRNTKLIFSTDLLKKYLFKRTIKKSNFNFVIKSFSFKRKPKIKKKIDFLIYHRKHANKSDFFPYKFVKRLKENNFKICIVGEKLNIPSIKNYGYLTNNKINLLQSKSKYTIASNENLYSFFILECLSNHVKIITNKKMKKKNSFIQTKIY